MDLSSTLEEGDDGVSPFSRLEHLYRPNGDGELLDRETIFYIKENSGLYHSQLNVYNQTTRALRL